MCHRSNLGAGTQMVNERNRSAIAGLSPKERRQLLLWGSILLIAMLGLIYLITPRGNPEQKPEPARQQTRHAGKAASAALSL